MHTNDRIVEPIDFREVPYPPRDSDFNDRPSFLQRVFDVWWPGISTWQQLPQPSMGRQRPGPYGVSVRGTKTLIGDAEASMPQGEQLALGLRANIRNPVPYGQGDLSDAAAELYPTEG